MHKGKKKGGPKESKTPAGSATLPPLSNFSGKGIQDRPGHPSPFDETRAAEPREMKDALNSMNDDESLEKAFEKVGYVIKRQIGRGGMAKVFEAESGRSGIPKKVAIKFLQINDETTRTRFFDEANLIRKIDHPNVIRIFESGEIRGMPYLVMEYLEGTALSDIIHGEKNAMPVERVLRMALQLCDGLQQAHGKGIIHRDIKPDNIYVLKREPDDKQDRIKILDFGIARIVNLDFPEAPRITKAGSTIGTPHYMSPEGIKGVVDTRTDIYSLGVTLYEMITGSLPFKADRLVGILSMHLKEKAKPLRKARPDLDIPEDVEALVLRAMEKKADRRFQTMEEMKQEIACCLDPTKRLPRWQRAIVRYGVIAALGITLAAGAIHFKDEIKRVFVGDEKAEVEREVKAEKDRIYVGKIRTNMPDVSVYEENQVGGTVVPRFRDKTKGGPLEILFMGGQTIYLEKEGYKRAYFRITPERNSITHRMEKR